MLSLDGIGTIAGSMLMISNSLNLSDIVRAQSHGRFADMGLGFLSWNWLSLLPMFVVGLLMMLMAYRRAGKAQPTIGCTPFFAQ